MTKEVNQASEAAADEPDIIDILADGEALLRAFQGDFKGGGWAVVANSMAAPTPQ